MSWLGLGPSLEIKTVRLEAERGINDDHPLAVEVVYVFDRALLKQLMELKARDYFDRADQLRRDFPRGFEVQRWEIVPGQTLPTEPIPRPARDAEAAVVFADYLAPGTHRARIEDFRNAILHFGPRSFLARNADL